MVALYLLDRSKRKQIVSTLRFWAGADVRTQLQHRRRIQQPWSLLLEIVSLLLLLAAIAGPRLGIIDTAGRDHVLILDTSAWMGSSRLSAGSRARQSTLMEEARDSARAYLRSLPRRDRVMLVRADALATPATAFESDFGVVEEAIRHFPARIFRAESGTGARIRTASASGCNPSAPAKSCSRARAACRRSRPT